MHQNQSSRARSAPPEGQRVCLVMVQAVNLVKKGQVEIQRTVSFSIKHYRSHLVCGSGVFQNIALALGFLPYS